MTEKVTFIPMQPGDLQAMIAETVNACFKEQQKAQDEFSNYSEFLTRKNAANLLGVSLGTLDNWTKQGRITKHRNGQIVRYRKSELLSAFNDLEKFSRHDPRIGK